VARELSPSLSRGYPACKPSGRRSVLRANGPGMQAGHVEEPGSLMMLLNWARRRWRVPVAIAPDPPPAGLLESYADWYTVDNLLRGAS
jgi:hypothetical protein